MGNDNLADHGFRSRLLRAVLVLTLFLGVANRLPAQQTDSERVLIAVQESMGMLTGFTAQSVGRSATTDSRAVARLVLPVGRQIVTVTRTGFVTARVAVVVVRDSLVTVSVTASMSNSMSTTAMNEMAMPMAEVRVSATRTERLAGESPIRGEDVGEMEVDEKTLMWPSGISMLLNVTPGLRVQAAAPGLGTGSVRILGLPGQYTVMLAHGLPLSGASAGALGLLDISPVDLQRVEIIKGAASALYVGQALGGVINLVSKPPYGSSIVDAVLLAEGPGAAGQTGLQNALTRTRVGGVEALAVWRFAGGKVIAWAGVPRAPRRNSTVFARLGAPYSL